jgi:Cyclic nucleotide-binding domain
VDPPDPEPSPAAEHSPPKASSPSNGEQAAAAPQPKEVKREENINIHSTVRQRAQRAQNIFANPIDLKEEYQTPRYPKSDAAIQFIDAALEDNFIFASLTAKERRLLIDAMMLETVQAGHVIIKQGETGDFFYVIEEGHVSFAVDNQHVGSAGRGGSFGELALLCKSLFIAGFFFGNFSLSSFVY